MRQTVRLVLCESIVVDERPVGARVRKKHLVGIHAAIESNGGMILQSHQRAERTELMKLSEKRTSFAG